MQLLKKQDLNAILKTLRAVMPQRIEAADISVKLGSALDEILNIYGSLYLKHLNLIFRHATALN